MNLPDSQDLLAEYVRNGSEKAFRELVTRYLDLVYSTALRSVDGDSHRAKDITQSVFVDLARLASRISKDAMLGGWLHRHTCYVATTLMRGERRRLARERQAVDMNSINNLEDQGLTQLTPLLDAAINELDDEDRKAILLRFYEQLDLRSVGLALGSSENAAQKRITRALDQLHSILTRKGVTISVTALSSLLAAEAVTAAPAGLAASIVSTAIAGAAAGSGISVTLIKLSALSKFKLGLAAAFLIGTLVTPLWLEHHSEIQLRADNALLRQQLAEQNRAPLQAAAQMPAPEPNSLTTSQSRRPLAKTATPSTQSFLTRDTQLPASVAPTVTFVSAVPAPLLYGAGHQLTRFYASSGSTIKMEGSSSIHDWQAESSLLGGFLEVGSNFPVELGQKVKPGPMEAHAESFVMVQSLKSVDRAGKPYSDRMDQLLYDALKASEYPKISYELTELILKQLAGSKELPNLFEAKGQLIVAGVTNSLTMPVSILPMRNKKLKISGNTTIKMTDFQIDPSSVTVSLGFLKVADEVKLTFVWLVSQRSQDDGTIHDRSGHDSRGPIR